MSKDLTSLFLKIMFGIVLIFSIAYYGIGVYDSDLDNYNIQRCYTSVEYDFCSYSMSRSGAMSLIEAFTNKYQCSETRIEKIDDVYNVYLKTCNIFE